jgi:hypothetical protein
MVPDACTGVICGIGSGGGVGNVGGGCPATTGGGGGSGGGTRVIGGGVGPTGSEAGCAAVEIRDGATGLESQPTDAHDANTRHRETINREATHLDGWQYLVRADPSMRLIGYLLDLRTAIAAPEQPSNVRKSRRIPPTFPCSHAVTP